MTSVFSSVRFRRGAGFSLLICPQLSSVHCCVLVRFPDVLSLLGGDVPPAFLPLGLLPSALGWRC